MMDMSEREVNNAFSELKERQLNDYFMGRKNYICTCCEGTGYISKIIYDNLFDDYIDVKIKCSECS